MDFKTLFQILMKYLADGDNIPTFFREFMAMITTVTEDEWGTKKDPSSKARLSDNTIRSYVKRDLPKKLACTIVHRLTPEILIERIDNLSEETRALLAVDLQGYDSNLNPDNVAETISYWITEIVQSKAGIVSQNDLQVRQQQQLSSALKAKYEDYLLGETGGSCPFPGCGKQLTITNNSVDGKAIHTYEVCLIDKEKPATPNNLLAVCPQCFATYQLNYGKKLSKELQAIKNVLSTHKKMVYLLDDLPLEKGIVGVIIRIQKLSEKDLSNISFDPKEIRQKIDSLKNLHLYLAVKNYVTTYFQQIEEIMKNLDKSGDIDYDEIQNQIHALYRRLKKANKSQYDIFIEIAGKIHRVTLQEDIYCQIIVSYFIQKCEVFDAIPE